MIFIVLLPWLCGGIGLGVGLLVVGDTNWLWGFVLVPVVLGYIWTLRA